MWQREEEFKGLLKKAVTNASKSSIEQLTDLAIADQTWVRSPHAGHSPPAHMPSVQRITHDDFDRTLLCFAVLQACVCARGEADGEGRKKAQEERCLCHVQHLQAV